MTRSTPHKTRALEGYLAAAARTGDAKALDQLVRLTHPRLIAHAARLMGNADGAQDIAQSTWVDILKALPKLRAPEAFRSFALKITTRKVARHIKGQIRDRDTGQEVRADPPDPTLPLGDERADAATVRAAIAALPPAQEATLALFYLEDLTIAEVATALDIPQGTVKTRLMHARHALRTALKGDDNDQTG